MSQECVFKTVIPGLHYIARCTETGQLGSSKVSTAIGLGALNGEPLPKSSRPAVFDTLRKFLVELKEIGGYCQENSQGYLANFTHERLPGPSFTRASCAKNVPGLCTSIPGADPYSSFDYKEEVPYGQKTGPLVFSGATEEDMPPIPEGYVHTNKEFGLEFSEDTPPNQLLCNIVKLAKKFGIKVDYNHPTAKNNDTASLDPMNVAIVITVVGATIAIADRVVTDKFFTNGVKNLFRNIRNVTTEAFHRPGAACTTLLHNLAHPGELLLNTGRGVLSCGRGFAESVKSSPLAKVMCGNRDYQALRQDDGNRLDEELLGDVETGVTGIRMVDLVTRRRQVEEEGASRISP
jgi:hypothetical protein